MEPTHIFYKEFPVDENNIFTTNIAERNEVEKVKFRKLIEYVVTGLSINQDIDSGLIAVTDTDRQEAISNLIQKLVKEKEEPNLDLKISNKEMALDKIIPFQKKTETELLLIKLTFYNTTTKKTKEVEFYNYLMHLEKCGFLCVENDLEVRYSVELSTNKKS